MEQRPPQVLAQAQDILGVFCQPEGGSYHPQGPNWLRGLGLLVHMGMCGPWLSCGAWVLPDEAAGGWGRQQQRTQLWGPTPHVDPSSPPYCLLGCGGSAE